MKKLTFSELFAIGIGFTLGSAVFSLTGVCAMYTGGSTFLAYIIGAVVIFILMLPTTIAGSIVPRQGVSYSLSKEAITPAIGGFWIWIFLIGRIMLLANITAFAIYFTSVFTTLNPNAVAGCILIIFFVANLFGLKTAAKVQKIMNAIMFLSYGIFIIFGIGKLNTIFVFNSDAFLSGGMMGFYTAVSTVMLAMSGGMSLVELGNSVDNPERNLPKACALITLVAGLLFAGIGIATVGALPLIPMSEGGASMAGTLLFKGPSSSVINAAEAIFANQPPLLYMFIFGGACLATATTINGSFSLYAAPIQAAIKDGWFPKWFGKTNKHGTPYRIESIFVIGCIVSLLVIDPANIGSVNTDIVKAGMNLHILDVLIPNLGLLSVPKLYPEVWQKSKWHMSKGVLNAFVGIITVIFLYLWYINFVQLAPMIKTAVIIGLAIGVVYTIVGSKTFAKPKN